MLFVRVFGLTLNVHISVSLTLPQPIVRPPVASTAVVRMTSPESTILKYYIKLKIIFVLSFKISNQVTMGATTLREGTLERYFSFHRMG